MNNFYWRISDGRIWGFQESKWMDEAEIPELYKIQDLYDSGQSAGLEYLKETIEFYGGDMDESPLDRAKREKKSAIDANTNRIRDRDGLSYSGERFAMTEGAKLNWTGMAAMKDSLPVPFTVLTIDDKPFPLSDQAAIMKFLGAVMLYDTAPGSPVTSGRALRTLVEAAQTIEEVDAIVDDRQ